jgi:hypothetical protein
LRRCGPADELLQRVRSVGCSAGIKYPVDTVEVV